MLKTYSEEEWFDTFYPKEWGNWRENYNAAMYSKHQGATGCCWMDYNETGFLLSDPDNTGFMKVVKRDYDTGTVDYFFVECGTSDKEEDVAWFLQPYYQSKTKTYFAKVYAQKTESNLDLYRIHVSGNDDSSYEKHFIGLKDLKQGIDDIKTYGVEVIQESDQKYFFTN